MTKRTFFTVLAITALFIFTPFNNVFAATASPTPKATLSAVADAEIERDKQITKELSLNMPDQTEDPNYPVTFIDPSKQGVDITVDEKTIAKAPNPFLLPNLTIGEHKIIFKFKTKDGVVRVLSKKLLLTPKAPQFDQALKTEVVRPSSVTIKGTALPQATIMIILNSDKTYKITSTVDGKWEFIIPDPKEGSNNILAFTIKNGIVSTASKTFTVEYKLNPTSTTNTTVGTVTENRYVTMAKTLISNIDANRRDNPTLFYGVIGFAIAGILLLIDMRLRKKAAKKRDDKTIASLFGSLQKDGGTIMDAIQSVTDTVIKKSTKKTKPTPTIEPKKELSEVKEETNKDITVISALPDTDTTTTPAHPAPTVPPQKKVLKKKVAKVVSEPLVESSELPKEAESVEDVENTDDAAEPEKKTLTKEEFLKQFQKGSEQDE